MPLRTIRDRLQIGTKPALTSTEWISRLRVARRVAQAGEVLPTTGSSIRISDGGPKNAIITLQPPWYKFEVPQPLRRPTQTHVGPSARAPTNRGTWGFGKGVVSSDFAVEVGHCARRAPPRHLGGRPEHGSGLRCMRTCRKTRNRPLERRSELLRAESPIPGGVRHSGPHEVLGGILVRVLG